MNGYIRFLSRLAAVLLVLGGVAISIHVFDGRAINTKNRTTTDGGDSVSVTAELSSFKFRRFEPFLGFGQFDEQGAQRAFLEEFPLGTPLDTFEIYFKEIGGRCFTLPRDAPGQLNCIYSHAKYWFLPFPPIATTWFVIVKFDEGMKVASTIQISGWTTGI